MRPALAAIVLALGCADQPVSISNVPIVNGTIATAESHPYAVFLSMSGPTDISWKCTGTLIAPDVVLTAAHCTVCAVGVTAWILGESAPGQAPGTQPLLPHLASSWSHNPAAFPDQPDCSIGDVEGFQEEIDDKTVNAADIGIVRLAVPSAVQPMPVLTHPPRGFNPRQDLFGQPVTVVGRGWVGMGPGDHDESHMRYGTADLDSWGHLGGGSCDASDLDHEPWSIKLINESWQDENPIFEASTAPADSGGPLIGKVNGVDRVIGVTSGGLGVSLSVMAPVFTATSSAYLRVALGDAIPVVDGDQDDVDDVADNCPGQANRDQTDRDEDGVGDLCDNCTPLSPIGLPSFNEYDGTPAADHAAYYNPDQANCNQEAEVDRILTDHPEYGSSVPSVTDTDFLLAYGDEAVCGDGLVGARHRYLRGDACDPIPCARVETITTDVTDQVVPAFPNNICDANGQTLVTCTYERPDGFWLESITRPIEDDSDGTVGLRFCECDGERDTPLQRRQNCGAVTTFNCAIEGSMYSAAGSPWKPVSIAPAEVDTVFGPDQPEVAVPWDFLGDLAAWSGVAVPPPPWQIDDGHIVGGPDVDGILWSRVASFRGFDIDGHPFSGGRRYGEIANWYRKAETAIRKVMQWREFPQYRPPWPWEYCARCALDLPWTWVLDAEREVVLGVGPDGAEDVSQLFDPVAIQLLAASRVGAAEPEIQLAGTTRREVVVSSAGQVIGALHVDGSAAPAVAGQMFAGARAGLAPAAGSLFAYSAVRDELYALASDRAAPLLRWTRASGWRELAVEGERVLQAVAMTLRLTDGALYLLDRERPGSPIRLVRIDLDTRAAAVVDARLLDGTPSAVSLSNGLDGHLLVAATFATVTRLARVDVRARTPQLLARADHEGVMVGDARETRAGVGFLVRRDEMLEPRLLPKTVFEAAGGNPRPIFPR